jgi:hypothetical protein
MTPATPSFPTKPGNFPTAQCQATTISWSWSTLTPVQYSSNQSKTALTLNSPVPSHH